MTEEDRRVSARRPSWLKKRIPAGGGSSRVREVLEGLRLNTVCRSALCPNSSECFNEGTATFLVMGPDCTRSCRFCAVGKREPAPLDPGEPLRVAEAAKSLGLRHVVVTSVTRDDLEDGGAAHFAATIRAIRAVSDAAVEVLVSDFGGRRESVAEVVAAGPDVFNHNVETVPRLYREVRPEADYSRSLDVLRWAGELSPGIATKSGLILGLGETLDEVREVFGDLRAAGVRMVTAGQYLQPSREHLPVRRFVPPGEFEALRECALAMGFDAAFSAPFVRSSYHAAEVFAAGRNKRGGRKA